MQDNLEETIDVTNLDWEMKFFGKSNYAPSDSFQPVASVKIRNDCCWRCASYVTRKYLEKAGSSPYCANLPKHPLISKSKEKEKYRKLDDLSIFPVLNNKNVNPQAQPSTSSQNKMDKFNGSSAITPSGAEPQLPSITINKGIVTNYYSDIRFPERFLETDSLSESEDDD